MNGVELVAGSTPKRFRMSGSIEPTVQPGDDDAEHRDADGEREEDVWSGYMSTRPIAMTARMQPSTRPIAELADEDAPPVAAA